MAKNYKGPVEKDMKSKWAARPPAFDRIKIFDHHDLTAKHCFSGVQGLLMLMGLIF